MHKDEEYFSISLCKRMEKYTYLDGPMHPYNPGLGQCHIWTGYKTRSGYGRIRCVSINGKSRMILAHRSARICDLNPIPNNKSGRHTCDNRLCVNPSHIIDGDNWDNVTDRESQDRNKTPQGEKHHKAKLSYLDIVSIKSDFRSCRKISEGLGVSSTTIQNIKNGDSWKSSLKTSIHKKPAYGKDHYCSKLNEEKVIFIRNSTESCYMLARLFNVSPSTITDARNHRTWKHIK